MRRTDDKRAWLICVCCGKVQVSADEATRVYIGVERKSKLRWIPVEGLRDEAAAEGGVYTLPIVGAGATGVLFR